MEIKDQVDWFNRKEKKEKRLTFKTPWKQEQYTNKFKIITRHLFKWNKVLHTYTCAHVRAHTHTRINAMWELYAGKSDKQED